MFNGDSILVRVWVEAVVNGDYTYEKVPALSNLREQVKLKLDEINYEY